MRRMKTTRLGGRWLRRGQRLARRGDVKESLSAFEAGTASDDPRVLVQHALALARAGDGDAAIAKAAQAATLAPDDAVPVFFRAYLMLRFGRVEGAEAELDRARKLSPDNAIGPTLAGSLDVLRGNVADGCRRLLAGPMTDNLEILGWILAVVEARIFERAGTDSGAIPPEEARRDQAPRRHGELGADDTQARNQKAETRNPSARACARRGQRLLEAGRPGDALPYLTRASELKPDDEDVRVMYGSALFEAGEFVRAEAVLSRAPSKGPLAGVAQFYRALNAYRLGKYEAALGLLDTLPQTGDVVLYREWFDYLRGMALVALGRAAEAAPHLAAYIDTDPALVARRLKKAIEVVSGE